MSNVRYVPAKFFQIGKRPGVALAKSTLPLDPVGSKGLVGNDPIRLDHDRYPRVRAHSRCMQCNGPKAPGLLRCAACNAYDVDRKFLEAAERFLGGERTKLPTPDWSAGPIPVGREVSGLNRRTPQS
jgi:hypothetical protein